MHACASPRIIRYEAQNAVSSLQAADVQVQKHCSVTCLHSAIAFIYFIYMRAFDIMHAWWPLHSGGLTDQEMKISVQSSNMLA